MTTNNTNTQQDCLKSFLRDSVYLISILSFLVLFESTYIYTKGGDRWIGHMVLLTKTTSTSEQRQITDEDTTNSPNLRPGTTKPSSSESDSHSSYEYITTLFETGTGSDATAELSCAFPRFFDDSRPKYPLAINRTNKAETFIFLENFRDELKQRSKGLEKPEVIATVEEIQHRQQQLQKAYEAGNITSPKVNQSLTFVHIGKAGGSSINCHLHRAAWKYVHCGNIDVESVPHTAISRAVNCYTHGRNNLQCFYLQAGYPVPEYPEGTGHFTRSQANLESYRYSHGNDYLVNLRSPLDRIASWFLYEHTENHVTVRAQRTRHCGQLVLNSCYRSFEDLTVVGLGGPKPLLLDKQLLRVSLNLTAEECSHWAWAAIQGKIPADNHNVYNYDWYAHRMLFDKRSGSDHQSTVIYALRVEHLEKDWSTIDKMLGGDGIVPSTLTQSRQNTADSQPLPVASHSTTPLGMHNLCRALCEEIQVYKQILANAVNLGQHDLDQSMEELRRKCPEEVNINTRECT